MIASVTSSYFPPPMPWMKKSPRHSRAKRVSVRARGRRLRTSLVGVAALRRPRLPCAPRTALRPRRVRAPGDCRCGCRWPRGTHESRRCRPRGSAAGRARMCRANRAKASVRDSRLTGSSRLSAAPLLFAIACEVAVNASPIASAGACTGPQPSRTTQAARSPSSPKSARPDRQECVETTRRR